MGTKLRRRDFLKAAQAGGMFAFAAEAGAATSKPKAKASDVVLSGSYTPVQDYPIQPKRYSEVKIKDAFWKPKITTNAEVTIPFEVQKLTDSGSKKRFSGGGFVAGFFFLPKHSGSQL